MPADWSDEIVEAMARVIDPNEWYRRDNYLSMMESSRDHRGGCTSEVIDGHAARTVKGSIAKARQCLALLPQGGVEHKHIWCPGCFEVKSMLVDHLDGTAADLVCDDCRLIVATLHSAISARGE